jgi:hypothetical protein
MESLNQILQAHVNDPSVLVYEGLWHSQPAYFYTDPSNLTVITNLENNLITAFRLSIEQFTYLITTGIVY